MTAKGGTRKKGGPVFEERGDRRRFLATATAAALGATAATLLPQKAKGADAATGENMIIGQANLADPGDQTSLTADMQNGAAFLVENAGGVGTIAIHGIGPYGATGLRGSSADVGPGVLGEGDSGPGIQAESDSGPGVLATSRDDVGVRADGGQGGVQAASGHGPGVEAMSDSGPAVSAMSRSNIGVLADGPECGVLATSHAGAGVEGMSDSGPGVLAMSREDVGVYATGPQSGVHAESQSGTAVVGRSESGRGVLGVAPGDAPAIVALSSPLPLGSKPDGGVALAVSGKAVFSTAGSAVVAARTGDVAVSNPMVTAHSHITVTLTSDPGRALVAWVERKPGVGFVVHLLSRPRRDVPFTYLVVEPASFPAPEPLERPK